MRVSTRGKKPGYRNCSNSIKEKERRKWVPGLNMAIGRPKSSGVE